MGILVVFFVVILVGVVLSQAIGNDVKATEIIESVSNESISISSTATTTVNETITISALGMGSPLKTPITSITFFGNATNSTHLAKVRLGTEVNFTADEIQVAPNHFDGSGPYNLTYTSTIDSVGTPANDDITSITSFSNATIGIEITGIDLSDEVNVTGSDRDQITVSGYNFSDGDYNISYNYEGSSYVANSTARTFIKLIPLFFVLFIFITGFLYLKKMFPEFFNF